MSKLRIEVFRSLREIALHAAAIDALNLASRRPSPFATHAYLEAFVAHDEYGTREREILFLAAFDGDRLAGYLPLRKHRVAIGPVTYGHIGWLIAHDTDRPHAVARPEDEAACAAAFYEHLLERERGWSYLELAMQDAASAMNAVPPRSPLRYYTRRFDTMPNTTVPVGAYASFGDYWKNLSGNQRRNLARLTRRLFASGEVEVIFCDDPGARPPLLDTYLDLERRSWKEAAHAGIRRHASRVDFFRALCEPHQPLALGFDLVVHDGVPIAGMVSGAFDGGLYGLETAYDAAYEDLAPGHLMSLMPIRRAIERHYEGFNINGNYAYYKAKLGGVVTPTSAVQIYRAGSLPWIKARGGELFRRLRPPVDESGRFNPDKRRAQDAGADADAKAAEPRAIAPRPSRAAERERFAETMKRLGAEGVAVERTSAADFDVIFPFSTKREAA